MAQFYCTLQGTVHACIKNSAAQKINVQVPSALHRVNVVFVTVIRLFAEVILQADGDEDRR